MRVITDLLRRLHIMKPKAQPKEGEPEVCGYCEENLATRRYSHVHFEQECGFDDVMTDKTTFAYITYSCDKPECVAKAHAEKAIRTEERAYPEPVLA